MRTLAWIAACLIPVTLNMLVLVLAQRQLSMFFPEAMNERVLAVVAAPFAFFWLIVVCGGIVRIFREGKRRRPQRKTSRRKSKRASRGRTRNNTNEDSIILFEPRYLIRASAVSIVVLLVLSASVAVPSGLWKLAEQYHFAVAGLFAMFTSVIAPIVWVITVIGFPCFLIALGFPGLKLDSAGNGSRSGWSGDSSDSSGSGRSTSSWPEAKTVGYGNPGDPDSPYRNVP